MQLLNIPRLSTPSKNINANTNYQQLCDDLATALLFDEEVHKKVQKVSNQALDWVESLRYFSRNQNMLDKLREKYSLELIRPRDAVTAGARLIIYQDAGNHSILPE